MNLKKAACLTLALLTALPLAACGGSTGDTGGASVSEGASQVEAQAASEAPATSGEEVTLQLWSGDTTPQTLEFNERLLAAFAEKNPNIKVEITPVSSTISDVEAKLNAAVLSDTYPDVLQVVLAMVGSRGSLGDFEKLQPYVDSWAEKDDLFDTAYDMGKYQGEQIALGVFPNPQIYVFRKDSFLEAGLDPENPPATWEELRDAAEKLTKREGDKVVFAGLDVPAVDSSLVFTEPYMRSAGSLVIDEINLKPSFTDEGAIRALSFIGELAAMNISIPHDQQKGEERPFMNGMAAISNITPGQVRQFQEAHPDVELGYLPVLSMDGSNPGTSFCGYQLVAMGATSRHKEESWQLIQHMLSNDVVWDRTETWSNVIVKKSLEEQFLGHGDRALNVATLAYVEHGKGKATVPWVSVANKYVSVAYEEVINAKKTADQALGDAESALLKEIE